MSPPDEHGECETGNSRHYSSGSGGDGGGGKPSSILVLVKLLEDILDLCKLLLGLLDDLA